MYIYSEIKGMKEISVLPQFFYEPKVVVNKIEFKIKKDKNSVWNLKKGFYLFFLENFYLVINPAGLMSTLESTLLWSQRDSLTVLSSCIGHRRPRF